MSIQDINERAIASKLIEDMLSNGNTVSVWEGEDWAIYKSTDHAAIMEALASTDSDWIYVWSRNSEGKLIRVGKVLLIYGNGNDLISDCSDNPATLALCEGAQALAETFT